MTVFTHEIHYPLFKLQSRLEYKLLFRYRIDTRKIFYTTQTMHWILENQQKEGKNEKRRKKMNEVERDGWDTNSSSNGDEHGVGGGRKHFREIKTRTNITRRRIVFSAKLNALWQIVKFFPFLRNFDGGKQKNDNKKKTRFSIHWTMYKQRMSIR